ncbi:hypothetical protein F5B17DRAFT_197049 [Nemania serpens]|nr:hypothetical protein F5B17DRAFT_197049 [Nemania serpens]
MEPSQTRAPSVTFPTSHCPTSNLSTPVQLASSGKSWAPKWRGLVYPSTALPVFSIAANTADGRWYTGTQFVSMYTVVKVIGKRYLIYLHTVIFIGRASDDGRDGTGKMRGIYATSHCDVPVVPIGENNCQSRQPASLGPPLLFPLFSPSHRIITPVTRFAMCLALRILTYIARGQANINNALKSIMFACTSMASPSIASRLLFVRERHSLIHLLLHL